MNFDKIAEQKGEEQTLGAGADEAEANQDLYDQLENMLSEMSPAGQSLSRRSVHLASSRESAGAAASTPVDPGFETGSHRHHDTAIPTSVTLSLPSPPALSLATNTLPALPQSAHLPPLGHHCFCDLPLAKQTHSVLVLDPTSIVRKPLRAIILPNFFPDLKPGANPEVNIGVSHGGSVIGGASVIGEASVIGGASGSKRVVGMVEEDIGGGSLEERDQWRWRKVQREEQEGLEERKLNVVSREATTTTTTAPILTPVSIQPTTSLRFINTVSSPRPLPVPPVRSPASDTGVTSFNDCLNIPSSRSRATDTTGREIAGNASEHGSALPRFLSSPELFDLASLGRPLPVLPLKITERIPHSPAQGTSSNENGNRNGNTDGGGCQDGGRDRARGRARERQSTSTSSAHTIPNVNPDPNSNPHLQSGLLRSCSLSRLKLKPLSRFNLSPISRLLSRYRQSTTNVNDVEQQPQQQEQQHQDPRTPGMHIPSTPAIAKIGSEKHRSMNSNQLSAAITTATRHVDSNRQNISLTAPRSIPIYCRPTLAFRKRQSLVPRVVEEEEEKGEAESSTGDKRSRSAVGVSGRRGNSAAHMHAHVSTTGDEVGFISSSTYATCEQEVAGAGRGGALDRGRSEISIPIASAGVQPKLASTSASTGSRRETTRSTLGRSTVEVERRGRGQQQQGEEEEEYGFAGRRVKFRSENWVAYHVDGSQGR